LPGVRGIACSSYYILGSRNGTVATLADGRKTEFSRAASDYDLLELYDLRPLAGRFFSRDRAVDAPPSTWGPTQGSIVINETMMRGMGYARAEDAVGQRFSWVNPTLQFPSLEPRVSTVIGVAPDFKTRSVTDAIAPTVFFIGDETRPENGVVEGLQLINLKISRTDIPQTLRAIDRVWRDVGAAQPIRRTFLNEHVERMYRGIMRQSTLLAVFAVTAIFIAALGLFGLAAFTAEQRTKEIGVRKAMGASSGDILRLLVWDFAKPVLWANVIAWPVGYVIMARWLQGFTYHIDLELWVFADASLLALAIAVATVSGHALRVARRQPVSALRYE
jgi:putative ABC transport system permease protein